MSLPVRQRANYSVKWTAAMGSGIFMRLVAAATYLRRYASLPGRNNGDSCASIRVRTAAADYCLSGQLPDWRIIQLGTS